MFIFAFIPFVESFLFSAARIQEDDHEKEIVAVPVAQAAVEVAVDAEVAADQLAVIGTDEVGQTVVANRDAVGLIVVERRGVVQAAGGSQSEKDHAVVVLGSAAGLLVGVRLEEVDLTTVVVAMPRRVDRAAGATRNEAGPEVVAKLNAAGPTVVAKTGRVAQSVGGMKREVHLESAEITKEVHLTSAEMMVEARLVIVGMPREVRLVIVLKVREADPGARKTPTEVGHVVLMIIKEIVLTVGITPRRVVLEAVVRQRREAVQKARRILKKADREVAANQRRSDLKMRNRRSDPGVERVIVKKAVHAA